MTATEFISSVFCDEWTYNEPVPITPEEAAETIAAWSEEVSVPVPPTVTPVLFSRYWNILCEKHCTKQGR